LSTSGRPTSRSSSSTTPRACSEFSDTLRAELDYGREATSEEFFRAIFKSAHGFNIPDVIEQYTRSRVLTEERVQGRRASEVADLPAPRRAAISRRIVRFVVVPALVHGVFYGDPHPGNLLIKDDGSLSVIDFGKVGRLTPDQRRHVIDIFLAIARSDGRHLTTPCCKSPHRRIPSTAP
jgi:ubiquinone biosynthesis protein